MIEDLWAIERLTTDVINEEERMVLIVFIIIIVAAAPLNEASPETRRQFSYPLLAALPFPKPSRRSPSLPATDA